MEAKSGTETSQIVIPVLDDISGSTAEELDDHLMLLEAARDRLEVEWTETLGVFEEREAHRLFEYPSAVAYLKDRMRMATGRANRYVRRARSALRFGETFQSWRHGLLGADQTAELLRTAEKLPDEYQADEIGLIEACGDTPQETKRFLDYWSQNVDRPGPLDTETQHRRRRLDFTRKHNGMIEGSFSLTSVAGEAFITSIDSVMPPPNRDDDRTAARRRHDALEDLAHAHLERGEVVVGGEKPHINVHVDLDALLGDPGGLHETDRGNVLSVDAVRRVSCDASVTRILFEPASERVDVGRRTRVAPPALRRAVIARDRHCTHPGCDRHPRWCDIHHIVHWADGGETELSNLRLLCRYHHTLHHLRGDRVHDRGPYAGRLVGEGRST